MKQNLILVVIFLATLLMVNATPHQLHKRVTTFGACPPDSTDTGPAPGVLTVSISPDPPVAGQDCIATIGATFPVDTPDQLVIASIDATDAATPLIPPVDICTSAGVTCPTSALSMTATIPIDAATTGTFGIAVGIIDGNSATIGCAFANVTV